MRTITVLTTHGDFEIDLRGEEDFEFNAQERLVTITFEDDEQAFLTGVLSIFRKQRVKQVVKETDNVGNEDYFEYE